MIRNKLRLAKWLLIILVVWWLIIPGDEQPKPNEPVVEEHPIVMLGDSITYYGNWQQAFPTHQILNKGVRGNTIADIEVRLPLILETKPSRIFVMMGINDLLRDLKAEALIHDYRRVVDKITAAGVPVVIQSTLYCDTEIFFGCRLINGQVDLLNSMLQEYIRGRKDIVYVDINKRVTVAKTLREHMTNDGLHLNQRGYQAWYEAIYPYIAGEKSEP